MARSSSPSPSPRKSGVRHSAKMSGACLERFRAPSSAKVLAAVRHVVAVHRREHDVPDAPLRDRLGGVRRLRRIQRRGGLARVHRAEAAPARARVAHDHDGRRAGVAVPALAQVGAHRLLAHRGQPQTAHVRGDLRVLVPGGRALAQPWGLRQARGEAGDGAVAGGVHRNGRGATPRSPRWEAGRRHPHPSPAAPGARTRHPTLPGARAPPARTRRGRDPRRRPNRRPRRRARDRTSRDDRRARRDSSYPSPRMRTQARSRGIAPGARRARARRDLRRGEAHEIRSQGGCVSPRPPRDTART